jgi:hypothetical protein
MVFEPKINIKSIDNINIIILGKVEVSYTLSFLIEKEFNGLNDDILSKIDVPISLILIKGKKII